MLVASDNVLLRAALADCIALPWGELPDMRSFFSIGAVTQRTKTAKAVARRAAAAGSVLSVAIATAVLTSVPASAATTYTVDNTNSSCSDTGPGRRGPAVLHVHRWRDQGEDAGDTVQVIAGTYTASSVSPASGVTFTANPGVTVSGGASGAKGFSVSSKSNVVISGFTITGTPSYGIYVNSSSNVTISGNTVSFAGQPVSGQSASGIYLSSDTGGLIKANVTHDNAAHGILLTGSTTGMTVQGNTSYHNAYQWQRNANGIDDTAPGNSIIGNVTYANEDSGINVYPGGDSALVAGNVTYGNGDHGIDDLNVTGGRIIGNTVYGNCTAGINVEGTSGNYDIENNVSMNNATGAITSDPDHPYGITNDCDRRTGNIGVYDSAPATTTANYNLVWQSGAGNEYVWGGTPYSSQPSLHTATGAGDQWQVPDPKFANAGSGNFQLSAGSPAIDSANAAASGEQATDILGNARRRSPTPGTRPDRLRPRRHTGRRRPTGPTAALAVSPASGTAPLAVTADASGSRAVTRSTSVMARRPGRSPARPRPIPTSPRAVTPSRSPRPTATTRPPPRPDRHRQRPAGDRADGGAGGEPGQWHGAVAVTAMRRGRRRAARRSAVTRSTSVMARQPGRSPARPRPIPTSPRAVTPSRSPRPTATTSTSTATKTVTVNAQQATGPTAALAVSPASGTAPLAVTADASGSTAGSSPISSYSFNFGDGTTAGPQPARPRPIPTSPRAVTPSPSPRPTATTRPPARPRPSPSAPVGEHGQVHQPDSHELVNELPHVGQHHRLAQAGGVAAGDLMILTAQLTGTSATGAVTGTDSRG